VNVTFSLLPINSMHFSVHYGIKNCISAFMHFYHSTEDLICAICKLCSDDWHSYFDVYLSLAKKPSFFTAARPFLFIGKTGTFIYI